jgi:hypothetical protein
MNCFMYVRDSNARSTTEPAGEGARGGRRVLRTTVRGNLSEKFPALRLKIKPPQGGFYLGGVQEANCLASVGIRWAGLY